MAILVAQNVTKRVVTLESPIDILKGVSLSVNACEAIAIVGASGSGKTTLLSLLAGLDVVSSGDIFLQNQPLAQMTEDARAKFRLKNVGFVFQNFELLTALTAIENVMLPLELSGIANPFEQAKGLLEKVGLGNRLNHLPRQLSGGEQQRVAIARAYVTQPKVLFADEPTGCLDTHTGEIVIDMLFQLKQQTQTTLIFVTHDQTLAQRCERIFRLEDGKLHPINK